MSDPIFEGLERPLPDHMGYFLNAFLNAPTQDGPPYVHTFQPPEPVPVLDDDGQSVLDEVGEPVTRVPLLPTHTITRRPDLCFHPNAATEHRVYPARWVRKREDRRWRLERRPAHAVFVMTCPDCPAEMYQLDQGMAVHMQMGPTLLRATEGNGTRPPLQGLRANLLAMVDASMPEPSYLKTALTGMSNHLADTAEGPSPLREMRRTVASPGCYEASWGWVHSRPSCRCVR